MTGLPLHTVARLDQALARWESILTGIVRNQREVIEAVGEAAALVARTEWATEQTTNEPTLTAEALAAFIHLSALSADRASPGREGGS